MKSYKGYPRGKPAEDAERLRRWFQEEIEALGGAGDVSLEQVPVGEQPPTWSRGKQWAEAICGRHQAPTAYRYVAELPGLAWPMWATVDCIHDGAVSIVTYAARSTRALSRPLYFARTDAPWTGRFEGEGAEELNEDVQRRRRLKRLLSCSYHVPRRRLGFTDASTRSMEIETAFFRADPTDGGREMFAMTTLFGPLDLSLLAFPVLWLVPILKGGWSLGVGRATEGFRMLDKIE